MKKFIQVTVFAVVAVTASTAWAQNAPVLVDSSGRNVIGRMLGGGLDSSRGGASVVISIGNQTVVMSLDADTDEITGNARSSSLVWTPTPIFFSEPTCTGIAYLHDGFVLYGGRRVAGAQKIGNQWKGYVSAPSPTFSQVAIQSIIQINGVCTQQQSTFNLTLVQNIVPLDSRFGIPPFFVK